MPIRALVRSSPAPFLPAVPVQRRHRPGTVTHIGLALTRQEMAAIAIAAVQRGGRRYGVRDGLFIRVLSETGARIGEALALTPARLGDSRMLLPVEKRRRAGEQKVVYLNPRSDLLSALYRYAVEQRMQPEQRYFPFRRVRGFVIVTGAAREANVWREKAGRRVPAWPHLFRHGAATAMLEDADDDAVFVQHQLGHKNIRETLLYAALTDRKRQEKAARVRIAPNTWE